MPLLPPRVAAMKWNWRKMARKRARALKEQDLALVDALQPRYAGRCILQERVKLVIGVYFGLMRNWSTYLARLLTRKKMGVAQFGGGVSIWELYIRYPPFELIPLKVNMDIPLIQ